MKTSFQARASVLARGPLRLVTAVALVRPTKSIMDVEVRSVKKKMKDKAFARAVKREDIISGTAQLGVEMDEHIALVIEAMQGVASELGLDGSAARG